MKLRHIPVAFLSIAGCGQSDTASVPGRYEQRQVLTHWSDVNIFHVTDRQTGTVYVLANTGSNGALVLIDEFKPAPKP